MYMFLFFFFFQAEDGIRDRNVTGVQTCALPIFSQADYATCALVPELNYRAARLARAAADEFAQRAGEARFVAGALEIGRASCRERVEIAGGGVSLKKKRREGSEER